jgi:hypothetical protein
MKKHLLIAILFVVALLIAGIAESQIQAGRFLVGTTLFNVADQQQNNTTQIAIFYNNAGVAQSQTTTPHTIGISSGLNLWAGYFVTKNLLAGLGFTSGTASTYTTLFRYYFNHRKPDSAKFDFFLQGNVSFKYTNTDNPSTTQYFPQYDEFSSQSTSDYTNSNTTLAYGLWVGTACHLTKHWSLEALLGYIYSNTIQNYGSYTITDYYNPQNGQGYTFSNYPALKNTSNSYQGVLRLMLTYRI